MYEDADDDLKRIVMLSEQCPKDLQIKAFEILLKGYVQSLLPNQRAPAHTLPSNLGAQPPPPVDPPSDSWKEGIPDDVLPRFTSMAARLKVKPERLADLFDFSVDPFSFAALHVDGTNNKQRMLRVALLVGLRSYLATGRWTSDWAEVKAMATMQNCYDQSNFSANIRSEEGGLFKKVTTGESAQLSSPGQKNAQEILAELAGEGDAP